MAGSLKQEEPTAGIGPKSDKPHHKILAVAVLGGFLDGTRLEFADGLNCIIGGRGTGKTTVLEFIRYALGLMPDAAEGRPRAKAIESVIRSNLGSGTIRLDVETKNGTRYRSERPWNDSAQILDESGDPISVSLDRDLVFKADIYSQNEIEEIAANPRFQLALIDKFEEEAIRTTSQEINRAVRAVKASAADLSNLNHRIAELSEAVPEIDVIAKRLQEMQVSVGGAEADAINLAHANKASRAQELSAIQELHGAVASVPDSFAELVGHVSENCGAALGGDPWNGENAAIFADLQISVNKFITEINEILPWLTSQTDALLSVVSDARSRLQEAHARQEQQYREIVARSAAEQRKAGERAALMQRHLELAKLRSELASQMLRRSNLDAQHKKLMSQLSDMRDRRFDLRKTIAARLSEALAPTIRVSIRQSGDKTAYRDLLATALKNSGIQYTRLISPIVENVSPEELAEIIRAGNARRLAERANILADQAARIVSFAAAGDFAANLEVVQLDDEPLIELKDGRDYKNSAGLSTGQRCTVILPILLLESERPLLIDQPEDNLDNAFIYDTIVRSLKHVKFGRQLIFVTHNPNIPVLGDAGRVFVFSSDGRRARVTHQGTVDDVKEQVEHLLEGGADAFKLRMQRYGH